MKYLILISLLVSTYVSAETKIVVIPSDYDDYTYSQAENFKDTGQMKDETYSNFLHRQEFMQEDLELEGYYIDEYEND